MKQNYYVFKDGRLRRKDNTVFFEMEQGKKVLPINDIESIYLYGEVDLNTKCINFLGQSNIPIHMFNYYGYYTGTFYPRERLNSGYILINQAKHYIDYEKRVYIARELIYSASYNIIKNLKHYAIKHPELNEAIVKIDNMRLELLKAFDIGTIMGIEGSIRNIYYGTFETIINNRLDFKSRVKRPPDNPMNALISFGNSMMYSAVLSEIYNTQLNPTISYLHEPSERRFSLSLDISEIFKPIIVDRIIFKMVNEGMLKENDFLNELNYCYLTEEGKKKFVMEFDNKMNSTITHKKLEKNVSYKSLVRLELYKIIKHITGLENYEGFKVWW